jgi:amino acid adenylation domain-containing protein
MLAHGMKGFRLSPQQQFLWALSDQDPFRFAQCSILIEGRLEAKLLRNALNLVIERHEILHMTFQRPAGKKQPLQIPRPGAGVVWEELDLRGRSIGAQADVVSELFRRERERSTGADRGPTVRGLLARISEERRLLILTLPSLCADAWSFNNLLYEIHLNYGKDFQWNRFSEGPLQYADFSEWQNEAIGSNDEDAQQGKAYWRRQNLGDLPSLSIPFENPSSRFEPSRVSVAIAAEALEALENAVLRYDASCDIILQVCWRLFLWRLTGRSEIITNMVSHGRPYQDLHAAMGVFAKALPIRGAYGPNLAFEDALSLDQEAIQNAYEWQDYWPLDGVIAPMMFPSEDGISFEYQERPSALRSDGVSFSLQHVECLNERFKLKLLCLKEGAELKLQVYYDSARFDLDQIHAIARSFESFLREALGSPGRRVSELNLLSDVDREDSLKAAAASVVDYPQDHCVHELFEQQAAQTPDRIAVVFEDHWLSYDDLNARANRLAHYLRARGAEPDGSIGICLERSHDVIVAMLGVLKAGGAYVPLDPSHPKARLAFQLEDARINLLLTQEKFLEGLPAHRGENFCLDQDWAPLESMEAENPSSRSLPENLVYVIYTSGSTGAPKGVGVSHRNLVNYSSFIRKLTSAGEGRMHRFATASTFCADLGNTVIFPPLISGGVLHVLSYESATDSDRFATYMSERQIDVLKIAPSHFRALFANGRGEAMVPEKKLFLGGESLGFDLIESVRRARGGCEIINHYGPTETTVGVLTNSLKEDRERLYSAHSAPIGNPIDNATVHILDSNLRPTPIGFTGEIYIGGAAVSRGYLNQPQQTAEKFIPDPHDGLGGGRLYRTGDLARRLPDRRIEYLGRIDHQVKIRGYRIETGEIEHALRQHPNITQATVTAREDEPGDRRIVAYFVAREKPHPSATELRKFLADRTPEYMIPAAFVAMKGLPLTANGKVNRQALPAPPSTQDEPEHAYVAPRNQTEKTLAAIWAEVLGLERVGVADNFFARGGDSIRSIRVLALAKEKGLSLSLQQLFQYQTISELAGKCPMTVVEAHPAPATQPFSLIAEADRRRMSPEIEDAYPLTMLQMGMLYHMGLSTEAPVYHNVNSWRLCARFDHEAFQQAVNEVIARHATLRTSFELAKFSEPLQLVHRNVVLPATVVDLRGRSHSEQEEAITSYMQAERTRLLDLSSPPLIRYQIHLCSEDTFQLTLTECHAISDGWSTTSTLAEIFTRYFVILDGEKAQDEPLIQTTFRDYVHLERLALESPECREFWNRKLGGAPPPKLSFGPVRKLKPEEIRVRKLERILSEEVSRGLRRLAQAAETPIKSVLLAAHLKMLSVLTGRKNVMTGVLTNGRPEEVGGEQLRGLFLNTLPFPMNLPNGSWENLARECFARELEMIPFRRYPMAASQRSHGKGNLVEALFTYLHFHSVEQILQSGKVRVLGGKNVSGTNFPLHTVVHLDPLSDSTLILMLEFDRAWVSDEQGELIFEYLNRILRSMAADPTARHEAICCLSPAERSQVVRACNETQFDSPAEHRIHRLFEAQVQRTPDVIAIVSDQAQITYSELNRRADRLASRLRSLGVRPESIVGVCLERSEELVIAMLGILKAGGAYAPLDPVYPPERLAFILSDAQAKVVVTQESLRALLGESDAYALCVDRDREAWRLDNESGAESDVNAMNLAYLIYTSGSTGRPKGVAIEHRNAAELLHWAKEVYSEDQLAGVFASTSICFDLSVFELFVPLSCGGAIILAENALQLAEKDFSGRVTLLNTVPSAMRELTRLGVVPRSARVINLAGEVLQRSLARQIYNLDHVDKLYNLYGPSEDTTYSTYQSIGRESEDPPAIGRPIANTEIYIVDEWGQPAATWVSGELQIGGAGLARGYHNRPELTAEKFTPNPFSERPGERLYRSGDLSRRLPDGELDFQGRIDHQVKIRGYRIELGEIEAALSGHPEVREAAAAVVEDPEGEKRLVAFVAAPGASVGQLQEYLVQKLPGHMKPSGILKVESLPLTPNGKLDRKALLELEVKTSEKEEKPVGPRTAVEEILCGIWSRMLGVKEVSIDGNFFELGGHSLLATQMISRVRESLGVEVSLRRVFERGTVRELAEEVERESGRGEKAEEEVSRSEDRENLPLSYSQQRLWFLDQLEPGSWAYNVARAVRLEGELNGPNLEQSLREVSRRHESLRSRIESDGNGARQRVEENERVELRQVDLRGIGERERERAVERLIGEEGRRGFDLSRGPLMRATLLRESVGRQVVLLTMHHIVSDGWSMGVLVKELGELYQSNREGVSSGLEELKYQYGDYAKRQRERLEGENLERQLEYWRKQLAGAPPTLDLLPGLPRPKKVSSRGAVESFTIPQDLSDAVKSLSAQEGVTSFMTLLAAFNALLSFQTNREDLIVGAPIAGRHLSGTEEMIGFFINTLVLRSDLSGDPSFRELLRRAREVCLDAYAHQDFPFDKLVEEFRPERRSDRLPLAQVAFNVQNGVVSMPSLPGLKQSYIGVNLETANFDLAMIMADAPVGMNGSIRYKADLFAESFIRRLIENYLSILRSVVVHPDAGLKSLIAPLEAVKQRERSLERSETVEANNDRLKIIKRKPVLSPEASAKI